MRGAFITPDGIIPNNVGPAGAEAFGKMMLRGDSSLISVDGNFWVGLTTVNPSQFPTLEEVVDKEPTIGTNGYSRLAIQRNSTGWPDITNANGDVVFTSLVRNFTASGGAYDKAINRLFICSVETGYAGTLFCISEPLPAARIIDPDNPFAARYALTLP